MRCERCPSFSFFRWLDADEIGQVILSTFVAVPMADEGKSKLKSINTNWTNKIEFHQNVFEDWRQLMVRSLLPSHCARFAIVLFSLKTYLIAQNICYVLNSLILWHYWVAVSKSILYLIDTDLYSIDFVTFPRLLSSSVLALVWFSAHFSVWYRVSRTCEYFSIHKDKIN